MIVKKLPSFDKAMFHILFFFLRDFKKLNYQSKSSQCLSDEFKFSNGVQQGVHKHRLNAFQEGEKSQSTTQHLKPKTH